MHTFLTGGVLTGKSTALRKFLEITGISADGFVTYFDAHKDTRGGELFIRRFDTQAAESVSRLIAVTSGGKGENVIYSEAFDVFGAEVLPNIGQRDIIVMDELGILEEDSPLFKAEIMRRIDAGDKQIFGVVKQRESPFLDAVRARPNVEVLTVTLDNRDAIPSELRQRLRRGGSGD